MARGRRQEELRGGRQRATRTSAPTSAPTSTPGDDDLAARVRALRLAVNEVGIDSFGTSPRHVAIAMKVARWLYRDYFRAEVTGLEHLPARGRVMLIANHSGQLPFDAVCIGAAAFFDAPAPRLLRSMVEHFVPSMPFISYLMSRIGQIIGTPENCRRVLAQDEAILVFPEGARGIAKPFSERYQLRPFGQGFLRLALETQTPILPVAVIGAEEQAPTINLRLLAKLLGTPSLPMLPFPPFVPLPLPVKYRITFGPPLAVHGAGDDDDEVIDAQVRAIQHHLQSMLHVGLRTRRHVFW